MNVTSSCINLEYSKILESTTSSQSQRPTPYNVGSGLVTSSDGSWNQVDSTDMLQNTKPPVCNGYPPHKVASVPVPTTNVSSEYPDTSCVNNIKILSNEVVYSPPNYINISYPRNTVPNGYTSLNPTRGINPQIVHGQNLPRTQNGQIIGGPCWPNQSALGGCISQSNGWASNKNTVGVKKQKRIRTAFTSPQMMELEQEYARSRYLDRARRIELAGILRLNERTIKIWFQNRRMKEKKDRAERMEDFEETSTSESSSEMGNIQVPMLMHEPYSGIMNDVYNQGNINVEQYPALSTPVSMPATSLPTSVPVQYSVQSMYPTFMLKEECQAQYQPVQMAQVEPYQPPYTEAQELFSEVKPKTETPTPSAPSSNTENDWNLSWIRASISYDDDL